MVAMLRRFVECESPSDDAAAVTGLSISSRKPGAYAMSEPCLEVPGRLMWRVNSGRRKNGLCAGVHTVCPSAPCAPCRFM